MKRVILLLVTFISLNAKSDEIKNNLIDLKCQRYDSGLLSSCYLILDLKLKNMPKAVMCYGEIQMKYDYDGGPKWGMKYGFLTNAYYDYDLDKGFTSYTTTSINFPEDWNVSEIKYIWSKCETSDEFYDL